MSVPGAMRVGVASVGDPRSPNTWSGITTGVLEGLREAGAVPVPINLALAPGLEQALLVAGAARTLNLNDREGAEVTMRARSSLARRRLAAASAEGIVQIGTRFTLPRDSRYVTFEDMTLRQGAQIFPIFNAMSAGVVESWERRRADIYAHARMCAVASTWAARSVVEDYEVPEGRVAVVGFGANHLARTGARDWSRPRFLFVGVDWERKGGARLLRAFARVRETCPQATLDVVGGHPPLAQDGVTAHGLLLHTRERDRARVRELFASSTCFVMPSAVEPFGIVHVEAASAGLPSIATSVGGAGEVLGPDGGIVVDPGDEAGLVAAMLRLTDPATARRMGESARARSVLYTWRKVAERLLRALGLVAADGRPLAEFL
jgi:glycosyltransferase involved in cell wall biosynthesis